MDKILISIKPMYMENIMLGKKTIELRKRVGKFFLPKNEIYMYSSTPVKALVAKAYIKKIDKMEITRLGNKKHEILQHACINEKEFDGYFSGVSFCYLIHLENINELKNPVPLKEMKRFGLYPPQSFCYLNDDMMEIMESYWSDK